ncbi:MAG: hypothetical protein U0165_20910 [Polyangiaceae bacterium]
MLLKRKEFDRASAHVEVTGHTIRIRGVIGEPDTTPWLSELLGDVHQDAVASKIPEVVLDIRQLRYANAAWSRALLVWLRRVRENKENTYCIRLLCDPIIRWQKYSVPPLQSFGADRLVIR